MPLLVREDKCCTVRPAQSSSTSTIHYSAALYKETQKCALRCFHPLWAGEMMSVHHFTDKLEKKFWNHFQFFTYRVSGLRRQTWHNITGYWLTCLPSECSTKLFLSIPNFQSFHALVLTQFTHTAKIHLRIRTCLQNPLLLTHSQPPSHPRCQLDKT